MKLVQITEHNIKLSDFDLWYDCYPRKKNKLDAIKAWNQTEKHRPPIEKMIAVVETKWRKEWQYMEEKFIPYPASFLRAGGFLDED